MSCAIAEIETKEEVLLSCPVCGKKAPLMDENGRHNFCPTVKDGKVVQVCMSCKGEEIKTSWLWQFI